MWLYDFDNENLKLRGEILCSDCNNKVIDEKYCPNCGKKLENEWKVYLKTPSEKKERFSRKSVLARSTGKQSPQKTKNQTKNLKQKIIKNEKYWYKTIWILGIAFTIYLFLNIYLYLYEISPVFNNIASYGTVIYPIGVLNLVIHFYFLSSNSNEDYSRSTKSQARIRYIPKNVQREVWRRDIGSCVECNSKERLEFDHIIPVSKGGGNTSRNIQLLCERCNRKKSNKI